MFLLLFGIWVLGALPCYALVGRGLGPMSQSFVLVSALPIGLYLTSLSLFAGLLIYPREPLFIAIPVVILVALISSARLLISQERIDRPSLKRVFESCNSPWNILALSLVILALINFLNSFFAGAALNPHGYADGIVIWGLKAKFMYRNPVLWQIIFSKDLEFAHPDYPLLIPGALAFGWHLLGREIVEWGALVSFCYAFSLAFALFWFVWRSAGVRVALIVSAFLVVVPAFLLQSFSQYADIPLACYMALAAFAFTALIDSKMDHNCIGLVGLLCGAAAWTKQEGLLFATIVTLLVLILFRAKTKRVGVFILFALPGVLSALAVRVLFSQSADLFTEESKFLWSRLPKVALAFLDFSMKGSWNGAWGVFAVGLILLCVSLIQGRDLQARASLCLLAIIALQNLGYLITYLSSPHNIYWHLNTSLERLLLHTVVLAVAFAILEISRVSTFSTDVQHSRSEFL